MSKTDIILKLKHIPVSTKLRQQAINDLVNDKLLILGDWFCSNNIKRIVKFPGYLKGFPENDAQGHVKFAGTLAKYSIDFIDYEQSFKKNKFDVFPRTLQAFDIRHKKWLYSQSLMETIASNEFLKARLLVDPSVVCPSDSKKFSIYCCRVKLIFFVSFPVKSKLDKRVRVPRQCYSPSDQN